MKSIPPTETLGSLNHLGASVNQQRYDSIGGVNSCPCFARLTTNGGKSLHDPRARKCPAQQAHNIFQTPHKRNSSLDGAARLARARSRARRLFIRDETRELGSARALRQRVRVSLKFHSQPRPPFPTPVSLEKRKDFAETYKGRNAGRVLNLIRNRRLS